MEIDLFFEFASPGARDQRAVFEDNLALARAADAGGFGAAWLAEHHFLGDYSNASCPDLLLAAMARETRSIGLGLAIVPLPIHDPVRVAERLATLDLLSGGRVMWGVGRGVTRTELAGFGIAPAETRARLVENLHTLRAILSEGSFTREGERYAIRPTPAAHLTQGWMAAVSPESFALAAELGLDVLSGPFKPWPMVAHDLRRYRALRPGGKTSFALACFCAEDRARARALAGDGLVWAFGQIFALTRPLIQGQLEGYEAYRRFRWIAPLLERTLNLRVLEMLGLAVVGTPDDVAARLQDLAASGLDRVSLVLGGGDIALDEQLRSMALMERAVLPRLKLATKHVASA
jgi:alkanesulfonate monooxygenase SsuD/methylene tetrahydromethanopterin reductase-like flavin-dependent oxidoreductase (luciferase family)